MDRAEHLPLSRLYMNRVKRIWYLSLMRAAHTSSESRGTFRQKARSLSPLNGWACAVKICHDGMLEDTNSLDGAHIATSLLSNLAFANYGRTLIIML